MKTITTAIFTVILLVGFSIPAAAQSKDPEKLEPQMEEWGKDMEKWGEKLEQSLDSGQPIPPIPPIPPLSDGQYEGQSPKLGIYIEDMNFEEAYERHYDQCYGVLVTGVVKGGNADRAGLIKGDIIMEFDGEKVRFEDHLLNLRDSKSVGDTVDITYFRNEKLMETQLTFVPYEEESADVYGEGMMNEISKKKSKLSPGYGGGYVQATMVDFDFEIMNKMLTDYNIPVELPDSPIFVGGGGMGNIGNGWFLGGAGAGLRFDDKVSNEVDDLSSDDPADMKTVQQTVTLESGYGGVTIVKKIAVGTNRIVLDIGTLIGGGGTMFEISQTNGKYSWDKNDSDLSEGYNYYMRAEKGFFVAQPSIGLLIRVKNWFGIHGSAGYLYTYAFKDEWKSNPGEFTIQGESPELINGPTASAGVWIGF